MIALAVAGMLLAACTPMPKTFVMNDAGVTVSLHVDRDTGTRGWQDKIVAVRPRKTRWFPVDAVFKEGGVSLRVGDCDHRFEPPRGRLAARFGDGVLVGVDVRRADDGGVYLVPTIAGRNAAGEMKAERLETVRVSPVETICASGGGRSTSPA